MRKVGGGGTAGGDRWEGEDEDEDVKVGAGRGSGQRGSELAPSRAGVLAEGRSVGRTLGPEAPPRPAGCGSRRKRRAWWCPVPLARRPWGPEADSVVSRISLARTPAPSL